MDIGELDGYASPELSRYRCESCWENIPIGGTVYEIGHKCYCEQCVDYYGTEIIKEVFNQFIAEREQ